MANFADVFKRKEMKYLVDASQRAAILGNVATEMEVDAYGKARVTSLYYDTADRLLIEHSLDKPLYKEKLRVRWYGGVGEDGCPQPQAQVFVELKKKFKGIVYKRRLSCSFAAATAFLAGENYLSAVNAYPADNFDIQEAALTPHSLQIAAEIKAFLERAEILYGKLEPSMLITCERTALTPVLGEGETHDLTVQDDVRITFDENIAYCDKAAGDTAWHAVTKPGQAVMEIKVAGPYPRWLLDALSSADARPSSFSKYGKAYAKVQEKHRGETAGKQGASLNVCAATSTQSRANVAASVSQKPVPLKTRSVFDTDLPVQPQSMSAALKQWFQSLITKKESRYV